MAGMTCTAVSYADSLKALGSKSPVDAIATMKRFDGVGLKAMSDERERCALANFDTDGDGTFSLSKDVLFYLAKHKVGRDVDQGFDDSRSSELSKVVEESSLALNDVKLRIDDASVIVGSDKVYINGFIGLGGAIGNYSWVVSGAVHSIRAMTIEYRFIHLESYFTDSARKLPSGKTRNLVLARTGMEKDISPLFCDTRAKRDGKNQDIELAKSFIAYVFLGAYQATVFEGCGSPVQKSLNVAKAPNVVDAR